MMVWPARDGELLTDVSQAIVDQVANEVVGGAVEGEAALVATSHELHAPEPRELVARPRQREAHRPRQVADVHLLVGECMHHPEPDRAPEQTEHLDGVAHDLVGGQCRSRRRDGSSIDDVRQSVSGLAWHLCWGVYQVNLSVSV